MLFGLTVVSIGLFLVLFCVLFVQWSVFPPVLVCYSSVKYKCLLPHTALCALEPFLTTMTSLTESFNPLKYTPYFETEQNERETLQWRLL